MLQEKIDQEEGWKARAAIPNGLVVADIFSSLLLRLVSSL